MDRVVLVIAPRCGAGLANIAFRCVRTKTRWLEFGDLARMARNTSSKFFSDPDVRSAVGHAFRNSSAQLRLLCSFASRFTNSEHCI